MVTHDVKFEGKTYKLPDQFVADVMETGLAGGISYWAAVLEYASCENPGYNKARVIEFEEDDAKPMDLTIEVMVTGIQRMLDQRPVHPDSRSNLVATYGQLWTWLRDAVLDPEDGIVMVDAEVADAVIQFALFEEIVYG